MYVVEYDRLPMARCFSQANISGYDGLKNLRTEETPKVGSDLLRQRSSIIVHRQQYSLDRESRVDGPAKPHEGVK